MAAFLSLLIALSLAGSTAAPESPYLIVLGIAQDGGVPQSGDTDHPGWVDPDRRRLVTALGLVDPVSGERWLFEATPDLPEQLALLDAAAPVDAPAELSGIFLTHAHIGHYTGLMYLGHEAMGARGIPVHVMPRMARFLTEHGPWSQLVAYENIRLEELAAGRPVRLNERLSVTPFRVPHREEFSEVVGYRIDGPGRSALFIPDIDHWDGLDPGIEAMVASVDVAFVDATFYADGEIPGRDMSGFPHPRIVETMALFADRPAAERAKIRFIHLNHTNPALWPGPQRDRVIEAGFGIAEPLTRVPLGDASSG